MPIDKAANNFLLICKKYFISKILNEIELNGTLNPPYEFSSKSKDEIIQENISFSNKIAQIEMKKVNLYQ